METQNILHMKNKNKLKKPRQIFILFEIGYRKIESNIYIYRNYRIEKRVVSFKFYSNYLVKNIIIYFYFSLMKNLLRN